MRFAHTLLFVAACVLPVRTIVADKLSVSELLDRYAENQDKLRSYIAKTEETFIIQWSHEPNAYFERWITELRKDGERIHLRLRIFGDLDSENAPTPVEGDMQRVEFWNGKLYIQYYDIPTETPKVYLTRIRVSTTERHKRATYFTYTGVPFLGIRYGGYERIDSVLRQADSAVVRNRLEQVGSAWCYVISAKARSGSYTVWIDPEHGYNIAKADIYVGPNDYFGRRKFSYQDNELLSVRNIRFQKIEGVWIPMEADIFSTSDRKDRSCVRNTIHHKITHIILNPDHEALHSFTPEIEDGTEIRDMDSRARYRWRDGMKLVVDERDGRIRYVPEDWSIKVGAGKELPGFEGFDPDIVAGDVKGQAVLVCFFDMNQRPSRYYVTQLAERIERLKEKGVYVVAVQVSKARENKLDEWTKKNNVPFPVGIVRGDVEKTRFAWGVRSLPWLILTNREHIVIAEGFGIEKLDEELNSIEATPGEHVIPTNASDSPKSFLNAEEILAAWENTYGNIKTMRVSYRTVLVDWKPPPSDPNEAPPVKYMHVERIEQDIRFHVRYSTAEEGFNAPESIHEHAFDGEISREYKGALGYGSIVSGLIGRNTETMNSLKDYMLIRKMYIGGRSASGTYMIEDPNSKPNLSRILSYGIEHDSAFVRPGLETVSGQLCHVVEVLLPGARDGVRQQIKQVFWVAHDKGMCLMKYQEFWDDELDREIDVRQIAMAKMNGAAIWYPRKAYRAIFREGGGMSRRELTVTEFVPNIEVDENSFRFDFPMGTSVLDRVRGLSGVDLDKK